MKYLEAAKVAFKSQLAWRFDIAVNMLFTVSRILLAHVLWGAVFAGRAEVGGFTLNQMMSYYVLSAFIAQLDMSAGTGYEIASRIRGGTFSAIMTMPVNAFGYFSAQTAGVSAFYLSFNLLAAVAWTSLFRVQLTLAVGYAAALGALALIALGLAFMMQLNFLLGILAFRFTDVWMFMMIKDNVVQLAIGALVPLMLLPDGLVAAMRALPFYYVSYLPTMALMGRLHDQIPMGVAMLLGWNAAFIVINRYAYGRLRVRYDGVGA